MRKKVRQDAQPLEFGDTRREKPFATGFAARKSRSVDQVDGMAQPGEIDRGGCTSDARAHDKDIGHGGIVSGHLPHRSGVDRPRSCRGQTLPMAKSAGRNETI